MARKERITTEEFVDIWLRVHKEDPVNGFSQVAKQAKLDAKKCSYMASQCRTNGVILPYFGSQKTDWSKLAKKVESKAGDVTPRVRSKPKSKSSTAKKTKAKKTSSKAKPKKKATAKRKTAAKKKPAKKPAKKTAAKKTNGATVTPITTASAASS